MITRTTHITNFGRFQPECQSDEEGYIEYHDSSRYSTASEEQLDKWSRSRHTAVRTAVAVERAQRRISKWRDE